MLPLTLHFARSVSRAGSLFPLALFAIAGTSLVICARPATAQELVLQWAFDEESGDAVDTGSVAPPADGVLGSGATRSTDTPGGGPGFAIDLSTPGTASTVNGGDPMKVNTLEQFTLTTWMQMTGDNNVEQGGSNNVRLISRQAANSLFDGFTWNLNPPNEGPGTSTPDDFRMGLFVGGANDFGFAFSDADIEGQGGEWTFVAVSYDGAMAENNLKFYWGDEDSAVVQLGSTLTVSNNSGGLFNEAPADFGVGFTSAAATADTALLGLQDDIRVYNGILELAALDEVRLDNLPDVTAGLPGDFNGDTIVDLADYTVWRDNLGGSSDLAGNGDETNASAGVVDINDYDLWKGQFGMAAPPVGLKTAAVPEPGSLLLVGLIVAGASARYLIVRT
jgi:hypothetical protein